LEERGIQRGGRNFQWLEIWEGGEMLCADWNWQIMSCRCREVDICCFHLLTKNLVIWFLELETSRFPECLSLKRSKFGRKA
jgi:hypothetical protein